MIFNSGSRIPCASLSKIVLAAMCLMFVVGCPQPDKRVIRTLPPPATPVRPVRPQPAEPAPPRSTNLAGKRIMIDPGHGGRDPGAHKGTKSRLPEKTIVLDIGNSVAKILQSRGAKVICTRTTDVFPSLDERAAAANRFRVDMFVSIHANTAPKNPAAAGAEVYIQQGTSGRSLIAARCVLAAFKKAGITSRGMDRRNLHVLREHSRPAILIETGFLTNSGDAQKLNSAAYRAKVAAAIADGLTDYFVNH